MLGVVNLDKPVGPTSHDMVGLLRRLTGTRRIGHAGTLDPLASGVLPILVGAATRFSQELTGGPKRYQATIRLGSTSATDDAEGPLSPGTGPIPDEPVIRRALEGFVGSYDQRPPAYSARKLAGRTAHRAARAGEVLELAPRRVTVDVIDVLSVTIGDGWTDVAIDLRCGAGTYVRSIARDLGEVLGCGGYLSGLRRTEAAGLHVADSLRPDQLEALRDQDRLEDALLPIAGLLSMPRVRLSAVDADRFRHGSRIAISADQASADAVDGRRTVFDGDDQLLGIGSLAEGQLQPEKVVASREAG
jgi:tRNA pseudouridine55 synthase